MPRSKTERPRLLVTHDEDGGITIQCPQSGVVLSVIETHPSASGPKGTFVEAYAYESKHTISAQDASRPDAPHSVTAYYVHPESE